MKYLNTLEGVFISRPNRFIAFVDINGQSEVCHVKNTGRCKELLVPGVKVILEKSTNPARKTLYDLIAVYKGENIINIDSLAPNKVFGEWLEKTDFFGNITFVKAESKYKSSRFDFYVEANNKKMYIEIKGVTLEENGIVLFPDAPTERGIKHLNELVEAKKEGFEGYVFFVVQMKDCKCFTPNTRTHPEFAKALKDAKKNGVDIYAMNCQVKENELEIDGFVEVRI